MGKYIKKSKIAGDVSVKDHSHQTTFNLRTRAAKNLALLRLRSHSSSPSDNDAGSFDYLQLRSRRLVKLPLLADTRKYQQKQLINGVVRCQTRNPRGKSEKSVSETTGLVTETEEDRSNKNESDCNFGKEGFILKSKDSETTPCSLRRDTKATQSVPSSREIEDFFAFAEQQQQRFFIDKYNFDIVSENPLPGRYEWTKVVP